MCVREEYEQIIALGKNLKESFVSVVNGTDTHNPRRIDGNSASLFPQVPAGVSVCEVAMALCKRAVVPISFESTLQRKQKFETIFGCLTVYIYTEHLSTPRKSLQTLSWCFLSDLSSFCSFAEKEQLRIPTISNGWFYSLTERCCKISSKRNPYPL